MKTKHEPSNTLSLIAVKKEFALCALTDSSQDPDVWLHDLERKRQILGTMGHQVSDVDLIIHIINNLPEDYKNLIENLESKIDNGLLDLEKLKNRLRTNSRRLMDNDMKPEKNGVKVDKVFFRRKVWLSKAHVRAMASTVTRRLIARRSDPRRM